MQTPWPPCLVAVLPGLTRELRLLDAAAIWARAAAPSIPSSLEAVQAARYSRHMQNRLVRELGDLEGVWRDADKQEQLMRLPLAAMQLLLGSSKLKVATEDTVLFTAQAYADQPRRLDAPHRQAVAQQLAQLIRCPHFSPFWLTAAARPTGQQLLLAPLKEQLLELLAFLQVYPTYADKGFNAAASERFKQLVPNAPSSWLEGRRQLCDKESVEVSWEVPVDDLRQWCLEAAAGNTPVKEDSPSCSAPLCGVPFQLSVVCNCQDGGVKLGVLVRPKLAVSNIFVSFSVEAKAVGAVSKQIHGATVRSNTGWGWLDFFDLGPMRGDGWDAAAWVRKRLPTRGSLRITAAVSVDG